MAEKGKDKRTASLERASVDTSGPTGWRNWRAANSDRPSNGALEYMLYTDSLVTGEIITGPYSFLNTVAGRRPSAGHALPAVVLRAEIHLTDAEFAPTDIDWEKTDTKDYLAGDLGDEVAALGALGLGRRLRSGGLTRRFDVGDSRGMPFQSWHERPRLIGPPPGGRSILPGIEEGIELEDAVPLLERYALLGLNDARALARAARLYSQALWVADDDPAQAWLRLVSALEVAADRSKAAEKLSPHERIELADPDLAKLVEEAPETLGDRLAEHLAPTTRATAKFLEFTLSHLPDPPARRPAFGEVDWDEMEPALRTIYTHRSRELHAGTPFPGPLCALPMGDEAGVPTEKIHSLGVAGEGAVWTEEDLPMHLHTFAYIAGEVLCGWWRGMSTSG